VSAALQSALHLQWCLPLDGPRAPGHVLARLVAGPAPDGASTPVERDDPVASRPAPAPTEGPAERSVSERPPGARSSDGSSGGSALPPELLGRAHHPLPGAAGTGRARLATVPGPAGAATGRAEADAITWPAGDRVAHTEPAPHPLEDLEELAARVGQILQEEARRSGIDV
jgi:hypothetical protein